MIDPTIAGLTAYSIGATAAFAGTVIWGGQWRKIARRALGDVEDAVAIAKASVDEAERESNRAKVWRDTAATLGSHVTELTEKLASARKSDDFDSIAMTLDHKPSTPIWNPRTRRFHDPATNKMLKSGAAIAG